MKISYIEMTITLANGREVSAAMSPDSDQRWGADSLDIAACVVPMSHMQAAMRDNGHWQDVE